MIPRRPGYGPVSFDATNTVKGWGAGSIESDGFVLAQVGGNTTFATSESDRVEDRPRIDICYEVASELERRRRSVHVPLLIATAALMACGTEALVVEPAGTVARCRPAFDPLGIAACAAGVGLRSEPRDPTRRRFIRARKHLASTLKEETMSNNRRCFEPPSRSST